ncbi:hypothetical protein LINGRAHAP2_LOCUS5739 [Linum grandiflorum]
MVADILQRRKKKIRDFVLRQRKHHLFPFDKEVDVLEADLKYVEAEIAAITQRKEEMKQRLVCETSTKLLHPRVSMDDAKKEGDSVQNAAD